MLSGNIVTFITSFFFLPFCEFFRKSAQKLVQFLIKVCFLRSFGSWIFSTVFIKARSSSARNVTNKRRRRKKKESREEGEKNKGSKKYAKTHEKSNFTCIACKRLWKSLVYEYGSVLISLERQLFITIAPL